MNKADLRNFDAERVARLDTDMWIAYSRNNKRSIKLFLEAFVIIKYELKFSWRTTFKLGYYAGNAAFAYRLKKENENYTKALSSLNGLFKTVSDNCTKPFNYTKAAKLELEWWDIQRYPHKYNKSLEKSLSENMAVVFNISVPAAKSYGHYRSKAIYNITQNTNVKNKDELHNLLLKAWKSLKSSTI